MIKCCLLDVKDMDDPAAHPEWQPLFSEKRWKQICAYAPAAVIVRKECAGAGLLLRWMFARQGITDGEDRVFYGEHKKPLHQDIHFNISHSSGRVLCVISDQNIGCDIQELTHFKDPLLDRICSPDELRFLRAFPDGPERDIRATELWAMKESIVKYTGDGIFKPMEKIFVDLSGRDGLLAGNNQINWESRGAYPVYIDGGQIREKAWLYKKDDFALSLCTPGVPDSIREVNLTSILNEGII